SRRFGTSGIPTGGPSRADPILSASAADRPSIAGASWSWSKLPEVSIHHFIGVQIEAAETRRRNRLAFGLNGPPMGGYFAVPSTDESEQSGSRGIGSSEILLEVPLQYHCDRVALPERAQAHPMGHVDPVDLQSGGKTVAQIENI